MNFADCFSWTSTEYLFIQLYARRPQDSLSTPDVAKPVRSLTKIYFGGYAVIRT